MCHTQCHDAAAWVTCSSHARRIHDLLTRNTCSRLECEIKFWRETPGGQSRVRIYIDPAINIQELSFFWICIAKTAFTHHFCHISSYTMKLIGEQVNWSFSVIKATATHIQTVNVSMVYGKEQNFINTLVQILFQIWLNLLSVINWFSFQFTSMVFARVRSTDRVCYLFLS